MDGAWDRECSVHGRVLTKVESAPPVLEVHWQGPFAWPRYEQQADLPAIPNTPGIYLQTVEFLDGYLIYAAGITRRSIPTRFLEHSRMYLRGDYTVLDIEALNAGERVEVWHGWGWTAEKIEQFEIRKAEIVQAARAQLAGFRIFVADIGTGPRILERLEAGIMKHLYAQPSPVSDIPDRGMQLAVKWRDESRIVARMRCDVVLHGIPPSLEI